MIFSKTIFYKNLHEHFQDRCQNDQREINENHLGFHAMILRHSHDESSDFHRVDCDDVAFQNFLEFRRGRFGLVQRFCCAFLVELQTVQVTDPLVACQSRLGELEIVSGEDFGQIEGDGHRELSVFALCHDVLESDQERIVLPWLVCHQVDVFGEWSSDCGILK